MPISALDTYCSLYAASTAAARLPALGIGADAATVPDYVRELRATTKDGSSVDSTDGGKTWRVYLTRDAVAKGGYFDWWDGGYESGSPNAPLGDKLVFVRLLEAAADAVKDAQYHLAAFKAGDAWRRYHDQDEIRKIFHGKHDFLMLLLTAVSYRESMLDHAVESGIVPSEVTASEQAYILKTRSALMEIAEGVQGLISDFEAATVNPASRGGFWTLAGASFVRLLGYAAETIQWILNAAKDRVEQFIKESSLGTQVAIGLGVAVVVALLLASR